MDLPAKSLELTSETWNKSNSENDSIVSLQSLRDFWNIRACRLVPITLAEEEENGTEARGPHVSSRALNPDLSSNFHTKVFNRMDLFICFSILNNQDWLNNQLSSVAQSCLTRCDPMNCSMPGLPVHRQLWDFTQTHVYWVGDAIQPSHPLSSPSPPTFNLSQHQGLYQWVSSCIRWPKYWSFSFSISPSNEHPGLISFRMDWLDLLAVQGTLKSLLQHHSSKASILWCSAFFTVQLSHPYMTTGKTIGSTRRTFVGKVMSLLFFFLYFIFLFIFCLFVCGMWDINSPTRVHTCTPCIGRVVS